MPRRRAGLVAQLLGPPPPDPVYGVQLLDEGGDWWAGMSNEFGGSLYDEPAAIPPPDYSGMPADFGGEAPSTAPQGPVQVANGYDSEDQRYDFLRQKQAEGGNLDEGAQAFLGQYEQTQQAVQIHNTAVNSLAQTLDVIRQATLAEQARAEQERQAGLSQLEDYTPYLTEIQRQQETYGTPGVGESVKRLLEMAGTGYSLASEPSRQAGNYVRANVPNPTARRVLGTAAEFATDPITIAGTAFGGAGLLPNILGRGNLGVGNYLLRSGVSALGAGLGGEAARQLGAPEIAGQAVGGAAGFMAPELARAGGSAIRGTLGMADEALQARGLGGLAGETGAARIPGGQEPIESLDDFARSLKRLQAAKAQGPEAFAAEKTRQMAIASRKQAEKQAAEQANARLKYSNTGKASVEESRTAMQKAQDILRGGEEGASSVDVHLGGMSLASRVLNEATSVISAPITLKSTFSPPFLRQGKARLVTNPVGAFKELYTSLRAAMSEETARGIQQAVLDDVWVSPRPAARAVSQVSKANPQNLGKTWKDVGGTMLEWGERATVETTAEERIALAQSWLGRKIRNFGPAKVSDRQAATMLNLMRTHWYGEVAGNMLQAGENNVDEYVKLRKFIEHATQRGSISQGNVPAMFSTRAASGRWQAINDMLTYPVRGIATGKIARPGVEQEAAKTLVGMVAGGMAMIGIPASLGIGTVEMRDGLPTLRVGSFHLDPWAGANPIVKFVRGMGEDVVKRAGEGELGDLPQDVFSVASRRTIEYLKKGLSPAVGQGVSIAERKDYLGQPYNLADEATSGRLALELLAPFVAQEVYEAFKEGGLKQAAATLPLSFLSEGVNNYQDYNSISEKMFGGKQYDQLLPTEQAKVRTELGRTSEITAKRTEGEADRARRQEMAESAFLDPAKKLSQSLPATWSDLNTERFGAGSQLAVDFKSTIEGFAKDKFDDTLDGYYNIKIEFDDGKLNWDETEKQRQRYLAGLSRQGKEGQPSLYDYMQDYFQYAESKKSPLEREYGQFKDAKEAAGYWNIGKDDAKSQAAFWKEFPEMEAQQAFWMSDVEGANGAALKTQAAVDSFMKMNVEKGTNHLVRIENLKVPINEDEGTLAAWKVAGPLILQYMETPSTGPIDKKAQLKDRNADVDAFLYVFGYGTKLKNEARAKRAEELAKLYGIPITIDRGRDGDIAGR